MSTFGKAVVAFGENGRGYAVLTSHGSIREFLSRFGPGRLIPALCPDPSAAIMVWEGEFAPGQLHFHIDGRWRECSPTELKDALRRWEAPEDPPEPPSAP